MIRFKCPNCNTVLQISREYAGQAVMCSACNTQLVVPQIPVSEPTLDKADANIIICVCGHCKSTYKVPTASAGRQVPCPKCGHAWQIPEEQHVVTDGSTIKFSCPACSQSYCVLAKYAGKKFKCLLCKQPCTIPQPASPPQDLLMLDEESSPQEQPPEKTAADDQGMSFKLQLDEEETEAPPIFEARSLPEPQASTPPPPTPSELPAAVQAPEPPETVIKTKEKSPLKLIAGITAGIFGFIAGFIIVYMLVRPGDSANETAPPQKQEKKTVSPVSGRQSQDTAQPEETSKAIQFTEAVINRLNQKTKDLSELKYQFPDELYVTDSNIQSLVKAMDIGPLANIHSVIEESRMEFGAAHYLIVTSAVSQTGGQREIQIGLFEITETDIYLQKTELVHWIYGISIFDENGIPLVSIGPQNADQLIAQMDAVVDEHAFSLSQEEQELEDLERWMETYLCTVLIGLFIGGLITIVSMGVVFFKAGEPAWAVIIPIYNLVILARVGGRPEWMGLVCALAPLIPFIGAFVELYLLVYITIGVAETFGKGILFALGLFFLPFIFYPILAATTSAFTE